MRKSIVAAMLLLGACAPANYVYNFDLSDPGAKNLTKPGERDQLEDADVRAEMLVDPTNFQAILLDLTNKTDAPLVVNWAGIYVITPEHNQVYVHPDSMAAQIPPEVKVVARLIPFALPSQGPAAAIYDNSTFELVVPMQVRGEPREYRYHLLAKVKKL